MVLNLAIASILEFRLSLYKKSTSYFYLYSFISTPLIQKLSDSLDRQTIKITSFSVIENEELENYDLL
jgi:hypothetical protein